MSGATEALILFAAVVFGVAIWKGREINIPFFPGGNATANGLGPDGSGNFSTGDQP